MPLTTWKTCWYGTIFLAFVFASLPVESAESANDLKPQFLEVTTQAPTSESSADSDKKDTEDEEEHVDPLSKILPLVTFDCKTRIPGYYADIDFDCEVFHYCKTDGIRFTFMCPPKSRFNQKHMICDYELYPTKSCAESEQFYHLNENLYKNNDSSPSPVDSAVLKSPSKIQGLLRDKTHPKLVTKLSYQQSSAELQYSFKRPVTTSPSNIVPRYPTATIPRVKENEAVFRTSESTTPRPSSGHKPQFLPTTATSPPSEGSKVVPQVAEKKPEFQISVGEDNKNVGMVDNRSSEESEESKEETQDSSELMKDGVRDEGRENEEQKEQVPEPYEPTAPEKPEPPESVEDYKDTIKYSEAKDLDAEETPGSSETDYETEDYSPNIPIREGLYIPPSEEPSMSQEKEQNRKEEGKPAYKAQSQEDITKKQKSQQGQQLSYQAPAFSSQYHRQTTGQAPVYKTKITYNSGDYAKQTKFTSGQTPWVPKPAPNPIRTYQGPVAPSSYWRNPALPQNSYAPPTQQLPRQIPQQSPAPAFPNSPLARPSYIPEQYIKTYQTPVQRLPPRSYINLQQLPSATGYRQIIRRPGGPFIDVKDYDVHFRGGTNIPPSLEAQASHFHIFPHPPEAPFSPLYSIRRAQHRSKRQVDLLYPKHTSGIYGGFRSSKPTTYYVPLKTSATSNVPTSSGVYYSDPFVAAYTNENPSTSSTGNNNNSPTSSAQSPQPQQQPYPYPPSFQPPQPPNPGSAPRSPYQPPYNVAPPAPPSFQYQPTPANFIDDPDFNIYPTQPRSPQTSGITFPSFSVPDVGLPIQPFQSSAGPPASGTSSGGFTPSQPAEQIYRGRPPKRNRIPDPAAPPGAPPNYYNPPSPSVPGLPAALNQPILPSIGFNPATFGDDFGIPQAAAPPSGSQPVGSYPPQSQSYFYQPQYPSYQNPPPAHYQPPPYSPPPPPQPSPQSSKSSSGKEQNGEDQKQNSPPPPPPPPPPSQQQYSNQYPPPYPQSYPPQYSYPPPPPPQGYAPPAQPYQNQNDPQSGTFQTLTPDGRVRTTKVDPAVVQQYVDSILGSSPIGPPQSTAPQYTVPFGQPQSNNDFNIPTLGQNNNNDFSIPTLPRNNNNDFPIPGLQRNNNNDFSIPSLQSNGNNDFNIPYSTTVQRPGTIQPYNQPAPQQQQTPIEPEFDDDKENNVPPEEGSSVEYVSDRRPVRKPSYESYSTQPSAQAVEDSKDSDSKDEDEASTPIPRAPKPDFRQYTHRVRQSIRKPRPPRPPQPPQPPVNYLEENDDSDDKQEDAAPPSTTTTTTEPTTTTTSGVTRRPLAFGTRLRTRPPFGRPRLTTTRKPYAEHGDVGKSESTRDVVRQVFKPKLRVPNRTRTTITPTAKEESVIVETSKKPETVNENKNAPADQAKEAIKSGTDEKSEITAPQENEEDNKDIPDEEDIPTSPPPASSSVPSRIFHTRSGGTLQSRPLADRFNKRPRLFEFGRARTTTTTKTPEDESSTDIPEEK